MYMEILSYWFHRLQNRKFVINNHETGRFKDDIQWMNLPLADHNIIGKESIIIFHFLAIFVREANIQAISKYKD